MEKLHELPATRLPVEGIWRQHALCNELVQAGQADLSWWFADKHEPGNKLETARRVCQRCPVQSECLQWAIDLPEKFGMWGGLTPKQRRRQSLTRRGLCTQCGIEYEWHPGLAPDRSLHLCSSDCRRKNHNAWKDLSRRRLAAS